MKILRNVLHACVVTPIWLYLVYKILVAVNATELMWFLYWIYIPAYFIAAVVSYLIAEKEALAVKAKQG